MPSGKARGKLRTSGVTSLRESKELVSVANGISCKELVGNYLNSNSSINIDCCCCAFTVKCAHSSDLNSNEQLKVFSILERNMKDFYLKSSWGWNSDLKFKELFSPDSRLLLCYLCKIKQTCGINRHGKSPSLTLGEEEPCAFVHFRFEVDARRPVLYCYEIQILENARGLGLGQNLLQLLFKIAEENKMTRVMLTVFKSNSFAYKFFRRNGFRIDATDPSKEGKFVDYSIMSRRP
ncbi:hypothetical protein Aperf_G00000066943 [Anoplocephala perfoliata]